jgi:hypothetical protein
VLYTRNTVTDLRTRLAALSVAAAIVAMTGGPLFAQTDHPICTARQHDCGNTPTLSKCCCGDQDPTRHDSTPVQPRVEVRVDRSSTPALVEVVSAPARHSVIHVQTSPPRLCLLDLPTLFSTFLI